MPFTVARITLIFPFLGRILLPIDVDLVVADHRLAIVTLVSHGVFEPVLIVPFRVIGAGMSAPAFGAIQGADDNGLAEIEEMLRFQGGQQVGVKTAALVHDARVFEAFLQRLHVLQCLLQTLLRSGKCRNCRSWWF